MKKSFVIAFVSFALVLTTGLAFAQNQESSKENSYVCHVTVTDRDQSPHVIPVLDFRDVKASSEEEATTIARQRLESFDVQSSKIVTLDRFAYIYGVKNMDIKCVR